MVVSEIIKSRDNQKLKNVRKVREGAFAGSLFVEGTRLVEELLRSNIEVESSFISTELPDNDRNRFILQRLSEKGIEPVRVTASVFNSLADTRTPQGIIVIAGTPENSSAAIDKRLRDGSFEVPIVVVLHQVNNPSNLGSVVRTAEAAGAAGVIVTRGSADPFQAKALRASMGSAFRMPIWHGAALGDIVEWGKRHGLAATAADVNAPVEHFATDWSIPKLLVFGSEAHGLANNEAMLMSELIRIPLSDGVESLNLAVSSGIILFEAKRSIS